MAEQKTTYIILRDMGKMQAPAPISRIEGSIEVYDPPTDMPDVYAVVGSIEASSGETACRQLAEKLGTEGVFRAVPERSWKEVPVEKRVTTEYVVGQTQLA